MKKSVYLDIILKRFRAVDSLVKVLFDVIPSGFDLQACANISVTIFLEGVS